MNEIEWRSNVNSKKEKEIADLKNKHKEIENANSVKIEKLKELKNKK